MYLIIENNCYDINFVCTVETEEDAKKYCETMNLVQPDDTVSYYYEPAEVKDIEHLLQNTYDKYTIYHNMVPKSIPDSVFTYSSGTVSTNMITIAFTANKYVSADINARAKELVEKYAVVLNSINMSSGYTSRDINEMTDWNLVQ